MRAISLAMLFIWISAVCTGQEIDRKRHEIDKEKLDSLFDNLQANNLAIGRIVIMQAGRLVYERTVGDPAVQGGGNATRTVAASTGDVSAKSDTNGAVRGMQAYRIGSVSKLFTAVMIYELIDQKRLSLEDTLSGFFPDLPNAGKITIAGMLGHRSGLANFTKSNFNDWKYDPKTHEQLLAFIKDQPVDFAPGLRADYNNSNFLLLGFILEKIYGQTYKDIVEKRILKRLGLKQSYYGDHAGYTNNEAVSYKYSDGQWKLEKAVCLDNFSGAGAMISTPQDMCRFIQAIYDGKLISKGSLARMTRIEKDGYGWGMFSFGDSLHTGYGHNGQTEGFASSLQYFPERKLSIAYCTNGEVYQKDKIMQLVSGICFDEPCSIPDFREVKLTGQQLLSYTGTYKGDNGLEVTGSVVAGKLALSVKGQAFDLEAISDHEFRNIRFGFFFEFSDGAKSLIVRDAAVTYWLRKSLP